MPPKESTRSAVHPPAIVKNLFLHPLRHAAVSACSLNGSALWWPCRLLPAIALPGPSEAPLPSPQNLAASALTLHLGLMDMVCRSHAARSYDQPRHHSTIRAQ